MKNGIALREKQISEPPRSVTGLRNLKFLAVPGKQIVNGERPFFQQLWQNRKWTDSDSDGKADGVNSAVVSAHSWSISENGQRLEMLADAVNYDELSIVTNITVESGKLYRYRIEARANREQAMNLRIGDISTGQFTLGAEFRVIEGYYKPSYTIFPFSFLTRTAPVSGDWIEVKSLSLDLITNISWNDGTLMADLSGNGNHGTILGGMNLSLPNEPYHVNFNGSSNSISIPADVIFSGVERSFAIFIYTGVPANKTASSAIFSQENSDISGEGQGGFCLYYSNGFFRSLIYNNGTFFGAPDMTLHDTPVTDGLHLVTIIYDSSAGEFSAWFDQEKTRSCELQGYIFDKEDSFYWGRNLTMLPFGGKGGMAGVIESPDSIQYGLVGEIYNSAEARMIRDYYLA